MKNPVVIVGIGEMGSVFARGFLRLGHPVYPVVRDIEATDMAAVAARVEPELVVVAVAERDIRTVLSEIPRPWRNKLV
jgi:prephenate dehydrogenase